MIMKVVASGKLKLEDYCHQYFDYWTKDPRDPRSRLQLHHLLSFTSGTPFLCYV
jgi:CubicO group peptidase (beta-lactamase class C family)